jgi:hypothetical protein
VNLSGRGVLTLPFLAAYLLVTVLFVLRDIPLTSDDEFYIHYFSEYREFGDLLLFEAIDEPLFKIYTNLFQTVVSPDLGVRILILLTILPHLMVAFRLGGWRGHTYAAGYFFFVELAPHLSWVQLRQGFAVGMLILFLHFGQGRWRSWGVAVLGLIHTSFLALLPCFLLVHLKRVLAYVLIIFLLLGLLANLDLAMQLSFLLGRRETIYLDVEPTYSMTYAVYSVLIIMYVTVWARDDCNGDSLLIYHAMCALIVPMFFMATLGAFAERLYFFVRCFELSIVVQSRRPQAVWVAAGYFGVNVLYTVYHSYVNFGTGGGILDRYLQVLTL